VAEAAALVHGVLVLAVLAAVAQLAISLNKVHLALQTMVVVVVALVTMATKVATKQVQADQVL
jgi:biotin transporter BioY